MPYNTQRFTITPQFIEETNYGRNPPILPEDKIRIQCNKCKKIIITDPLTRGKIVDACKWICDNCISHLHEREYCDQRCFSRKDYTHTIYQDPELNLDKTGEYEYGCGIPNHKNCNRIFPIQDIRLADGKGKFGYPLRYIQIRDFR